MNSVIVINNSVIRKEKEEENTNGWHKGEEKIREEKGRKERKVERK